MHAILYKILYRVKTSKKINLKKDKMENSDKYQRLKNNYMTTEKNLQIYKIKFTPKRCENKNGYKDTPPFSKKAKKNIRMDSRISLHR